MVNKQVEMSGAVIGSIVALIFLIFMVIGMVIIWRHCRCPAQQGAGTGRGATANGQYSPVLMGNHLGGRDSASKYLSGQWASKASGSHCVVCVILWGTSMSAHSGNSYLLYILALALLLFSKHQNSSPYMIDWIFC